MDTLSEYIIAYNLADGFIARNRIFQQYLADVFEGIINSCIRSANIPKCLSRDDIRQELMMRLLRFIKEDIELISKIDNDKDIRRMLSVVCYRDLVDYIRVSHPFYERTKLVSNCDVYATEI